VQRPSLPQYLGFAVAAYSEPAYGIQHSAFMHAFTVAIEFVPGYLSMHRVFGYLPIDVMRGYSIS
jgi:hypothetical protein